MKGKGIVLALVVLGCLLGLWAVVDTGVYTENEADAALTKGFLAFRDQDFDKVGRISLAKGDGAAVELKKSGESWVVASLWDTPADAEKVEKIIESLADIDTGEERGRSATSHERFEVGADKGAVITCYGADGTALDKLIVGKTATGGSIGTTRVFVRFGEEEETFEVESNVRSEASLWGDEVEAKNYIEKDIFKLDETMEIQSVRVVRPDQQDLIIERRWREVPVENADEDDATAADGEDAAAEEKEPETKKEEYFVVTSGAESAEVPSAQKYTASGLLNRAKSVMIDDAAEPKDRAEYGLAEPQLTALVSYRLKDDPESALETVALHFGNAKKDEQGEDKDYYFALDEGEEKGRTYIVRDYRYTGWDKKYADFFPKPEEDEDDDEGTVEDDAEADATPVPATDGGEAETSASTDDPVSSDEVVGPPEQPAPASGDDGEGTAGEED